MEEQTRARLAQLGEALQHIATDDTDLQAAIDDILAVGGLLAQLVEVARAQQTELAALRGLIERSITRAEQAAERGANERGVIKDLMVQLRELARKQVRQLDDLERVVGMSQPERAAWRDAPPEEES